MHQGLAQPQALSSEIAFWKQSAIEGRQRNTNPGPGQDRPAAYTVAAVSGTDLESLIRRAADGDANAANELARRYAPGVRAAIRPRLGPELRNRVDTEDILQSTLTASLEDVARLDFRGEKAFVGWLCRVAERRIVDAARRHRAARRDVRREQPLATGDDVIGRGTSPSQAAVRGERARSLREAVAQLPEEERHVVELHSFEGLGFKEVAARLGLKDKERARYLFRRALRKMEDHFGTYGMAWDE